VCMYIYTSIPGYVKLSLKLSLKLSVCSLSLSLYIYIYLTTARRIRTVVLNSLSKASLLLSSKSLFAFVARICNEEI